MKGLTIIVAALCVAFYMASNASAGRFHSDQVTQGLLCIHQFEGSWSDPNAPFWGGLQMDMSFQKTYGYMYMNVKLFGKHVKRMKVRFLDVWGTADHWPIQAQLQAGRNAYKSRGWWPWPNTARYCGLLF